MSAEETLAYLKLIGIVRKYPNGQYQLTPEAVNAIFDAKVHPEVQNDMQACMLAFFYFSHKHGDGKENNEQLQACVSVMMRVFSDMLRKVSANGTASVP